MNRFEFALAASANFADLSLLQLAQQFMFAVAQAEGEGMHSGEDPAVLVLGAFIAFHTHADVNTAGGYSRMLTLCENHLANPRVLN